MRKTLTERDIREALAKGRVKPEVIEHRTLARTGELLQATNPEIAALREAEQILADHQRPRPDSSSVQPGLHRKYRLGQAAMGLSVWLALVFPFAVWQLWPVLQSGVGGFWAVLITIGAAVVILAIAAASYDYACIEPGAGFGMAFGTGMAAGFPLMLALLLEPTHATLGLFTAWVIWLPSGLIAAFLTFAAFLAAYDDLEADFEAGDVVRTAAVAIPLAAITWVSAESVNSHTQHWVPVASAAAVSFAVMVVLRPLTARPRIGAGKWIPRWLSRDPRRRGSPSWRARLEQLENLAYVARTAWERAAVDKAIRPLILRQVNDMVSPPFSTTLEVLDAPGLRNLRASEFVVATSTFDQFRRATSGIGSGAVGIAGSRGAGKSTLLEAYRDGIFLGPGEEHIALVETVPVRYDARDFTLHLYAGLCREVIRFGSRHPRGAPSRWRRVARWLREVAVVPVVLAAWLAVGYLGTTTLRAPELAVFREGFWWPLIAVIGLASVIFLAVKRRPPAARVAMGTQDVVNLRTLCECAEDKLDAIQYLQKHTSGWSGKVGLLFGAEGSRSGAVEFARQAMTYPEVVHDFRQFLTTAARILGDIPTMGSIRIAIILDELDKILSPESAQEFVNEVKALFAIDVPGCLFLVSVSEDALAAFERRGLPVRDAFDSAFDTIFRVDYLDLADARALLRSRVLGMSEPFVCLCHSVSGGLPRELIRTARTVVAAPQRALAAVCQSLVAADLIGKAGALRTIIARHLNEEPSASELMRHIQLYAKPDADRLLLGVRNPPIPFSGDNPSDLWHLQLEALGYLYYAATLLEVFDEGLTENQLERGRISNSTGGFNTLASVRQLFSVNVRLAWLTVSDFRQEWGLPAISPPEGEKSVAARRGQS